jgi:transcriptional regulator with GAF, ATPase, and Fis domain
MNANLFTPTQPWPPSTARKQPTTGQIAPAPDVYEATLAFNGHAHTLQRQKELEALVKKELAGLTNRPDAELETKIESSLLRVGDCLEHCEGVAAGQGLAALFKLSAQASASATANCLRLEAALTESYAENKRLKERLVAESDYLRSEIKLSHAHGEIIGRSPGIKRVLHQVEQVAAADCSVLITGETGTGKELVAREIHKSSARKDRMMVLVNCAALPSALVESELFGRERGAYTGALTSQVGRFEMADSSTIFLDEVGELSMEVQAKLLRVLQEGEFQRLGSPKTHKVNVRVIAATNRDLAEEVRAGKFREDLYYRLRVFPIDIPPLRERPEDIPALVFAFMEEFSMRMGRKITNVPRKTMDALQKHPWPGNIRELRNAIEHGVILSTADTLKISPLGESPTREPQAVTLVEVEREHILRTLESTGWRIKGPHGAAKKLDLQPSTLYSRMQRLGIPHRRQKDQLAVVA